VNDLERAVVEAARKVCDHATNLDEWVYPLRRAVVELDEYDGLWEEVRVYQGFSGPLIRIELHPRPAIPADATERAHE